MNFNCSLYSSRIVAIVWLIHVLSIRNVTIPGRVAVGVHAWDTPAQRATKRQRGQNNRKEVFQRVNECFVSTATNNYHHYQANYYGGPDADAGGLYDYDEEKKNNQTSTTFSAYYSFLESMRAEFWGKIYSQIYDTQPPRDVLYGFLSAATNFWNGYSNAFSIIISYPWEGYARDGLVGFFQDSFVGVLSGAVVAVSGAVAGLSQFALGVSNTIKSSWNRKMHWDNYRRQWTTRPNTLEEEKIEIEQLLREESSNRKQSQQPKSNMGSKPRTRRIKDMSYYNMLKVRADATKSDIKRAYYREARKVHPDKMKDDARAATKFHKLKSVYDTLMDEDMRQVYDSSDSAICFENDVKNTDTASTPDLDADVFFTVFFGSLSVEPYIGGQLAIASIVDNLIQTNDAAKAFHDLNEGSKKLEGSVEQRKRRIDVALHLRDRVASYVNAKGGTTTTTRSQYQQQLQNDFLTSCRKEAQYIGTGNFGDIFLEVIGSVLKSESEQFLGDHNSLWRVKGYAIRAHIQSVDLISSLSYAVDFTFVKKSVKAYFRKAREEAEVATATSDSPGDGDSTTTECNKSKSKSQVSVDKILQERSTRDLLLKVVWKYNTQDITSTLRAACNLLFSEHAPLVERLTRAEALRMLGEEFISMGRKINDEATKRSKDKQYTAWAEAAILQASIATDYESAAYF